jgi:2-polyprenyl-3-methyl-5-hydroxy-6-metoxy-1,4-benzoquinol methylase
VPSIGENLERWDRPDWAHNEEGEKWSSLWGGSETQWFGSLHFRLHSFLPCRRILEIAPGHGRWTQYLRSVCDELHVVDLSANCIEACRRRFAADSHIHYHVNDGSSLAMVPAGFDVIFSFDSLVHSEIDIIDAYLAQMAGLLAPDGVGFLHHSNMAEYMKRGLSHVPRPILEREGFNTIWRAESVDASTVAALANEHGLAVIGQELVNWGAQGLYGAGLFTDCFSLFTRRGSRWERENRVFGNDRYVSDEAPYMRRLGELYNGSSFPKDPVGEANP